MFGSTLLPLSTFALLSSLPLTVSSQSSDDQNQSEPCKIIGCFENQRCVPSASSSEETCAAVFKPVSACFFETVSGKCTDLNGVCGFEKQPTLDKCLARMKVDDAKWADYYMNFDAVLEDTDANEFNSNTDVGDNEDDGETSAASSTGLRFEYPLLAVMMLWLI